MSSPTTMFDDPATHRLAGAGGLDVVLPGGVDDPRTPSGGNTYDLRVVEALVAAGVPVRRHDVDGPWPQPTGADRDRLDAVLAGVPDGAPVLLDGLVGCAAPDVLEAHAERLRVAVVVHLPLADETGLGPDEAAARSALEGRAVRAATTVVATSAATATRVETVHGLPPGSVRVALPGVRRADRATGSDAGGRLLTVASLTPRKGQDVLLDALALLPADAGWQLDVVGPDDPGGSFAAAVRATVAERGWTDRVRFHGPLAGPALDAAYATADLLVLASRAEPYGMVVTEALARAVPVVATWVDGVPEALGEAADGDRPGLLVPPGDPDLLATALRAWLDSADLRQRLRTAALDRRDQLPDWTRTAAALAAALDRRTG